MTPELFGLLVGGLLGAGGLTSLLKAWFDKSKTDADALAVWNTVWTGNLDVMKTEIAELRARVAALEAELAREQLRSRVLSALLIEHGGTPPPHTD